MWQVRRQSPCEHTPSQVVVSQLAAQTIPAITATNYPQISNNRFLNDPRTTDNLQINNSKQVHNHSIKFGFISEVEQINATDVRSAQFDFTRGMTAGPIASTDSTKSGVCASGLSF